MKTLSHMVGVLALLVAASPLRAQPAEDPVRVAARQLGMEGLSAYQSGNYPDALDKLGRAYAVLSVPTIGLWSARTLEKLGRLVEASQRYREVIGLEVKGGDVALQEEAKAVAREELAALQARIPKLRVEVAGAPPGDVEVRVDGKAVDAHGGGQDVLVDPGRHEVLATVGDRAVKRDVTVAEGESRTVMLRFGAADPDAPEPAPAPAEPAAVGPEPTPDPPPAPAVEPAPPPELAPDLPPRGALQRTLGWTSLGLGGAGLVVWAVGAGVANGKKTALDDGGCTGHVCGPSQYDAVDSYQSWRTVSTVGFVVGVVGVSTGALLLVTAPSARSSARPRVAPWVGWASTGVAGEF